MDQSQTGRSDMNLSLCADLECLTQIVLSVVWKHQVRRFSEAYFFTEHPKEISLTFQEEL